MTGEIRNKNIAMPGAHVGMQAAHVSGGAHIATSGALFEDGCDEKVWTRQPRYRCPSLLTEAAPRCRSARVVNGPPRYSAYAIQLFLLTESGVRQVTVSLDFTTGSFHDERRATFRYDTIASASVAEVGVRFDGNQRKIVVLGAYADNRNLEDDLRELIVTRSFRLALVSGQLTDVLVENYDGFVHPELSEDRQHLVGLAMDTSGVSTALRIFEAVAAEGRDWFRRERLQRERRMSDYMQNQDGVAGRYMLGINGARSYPPALGRSPDQAR